MINEVFYSMQYMYQHEIYELLSEVDDAFCKSHPLLAQKVVTRSARAAVSKTFVT